MSEETPKLGDRIPAQKFFVSERNVRVNEVFGDNEEDRMLTLHLRDESIKQPFVARPEKEGFGVVMGRRRFLAKKKAGARFFTVGEDVLIRMMPDDEALNSSILENMDYFKREVNPVLRANSIKRLLETKHITQGMLSKQWKVPKQTLSSWLKILELIPNLRELLERGLFGFKDAYQIAFMRLDSATQENLTEILVNEGYDGFKKELTQIKDKRETRGAPKNQYRFLRPTFQINNQEDTELYSRWEQLAKVMNKDPSEMVKDAMRFYMERPHS